MLHRYSRAYAPMVRSPGLFNQNTARSSPSTPANYAMIPAQNNNCYNPSLYASQYRYQSYSPSQYNSSPTPYLPQPYPSYPPYSSYLPNSSYQTLPKSPSSPQFPISSYATPAISYAPTASSRGLVLVLIATLILVALDLVIIRPQKSRAQIRGSADVHDLVNI